MSLLNILNEIRAAGWMVAVHNDYRQNGRVRTFWLFTKNGRVVKGEGETDEEALRIASDDMQRVALEMVGKPPPVLVDIFHEKMAAAGWTSEPGAKYRRDIEATFAAVIAEYERRRPKSNRLLVFEERVRKAIQVLEEDTLMPSRIAAACRILRGEGDAARLERRKREGGDS